MFKKFLLALAVAVPAVAFTSCSDDDDLPDVNFDVAISGGTVVDGTIYTVAGDTLTIDGIKVVNNENKNAIISYANYYWDYRYIGQNPVEPFGYQIYISEATVPGKHILEIYTPVFAVDKEPAFAVLAYPVVVVDDEADLPDGGVATLNTTPTFANDEPSK
ncbi:MAG: hypothetical protein K2M61_07365 [Muribaculaceae bacterium]|nr:hypothetical protein [Muribaculaceae bacterium]